MPLFADQDKSVWAKTGRALYRSNLLWYGATASIVSGIPIVLLPFLLNRLPAAGYAQIVSMQVIVMFGGLLITAGTDSSVARDALRTRQRHLATHVSVALYVQLTMFGILSVLALFLAKKLEALIEYPARYLWPTLLGCLFQQITLCTANLMRLLGKVGVYAFLSISQAVLEIGLSLVLLYQIEPTWEARLWGFLAASTVTALISIYLLRKMRLLSRRGYAGTVLRRMLNFGLPTLPHSAFSLLSAWADRFILIKFCGATIAGVYSAAAQSIFVINFTGSIANLAWTPWLYQRLSSRQLLEQSRPNIVRATIALSIFLTVTGVLIFAALWTYFNWAAPIAYRNALPLLPWLALGAICNAVYKVGTSFLFFYGKTRYLAAVAFVVLSLSLTLQWALVPRYQGLAAASIFAAINLAQMSLTWVMAQRLFGFSSRVVPIN